MQGRGQEGRGIEEDHGVAGGVRSWTTFEDVQTESMRMVEREEM